MSKPKNTLSKGDTLAGLAQFGFEGEPVRMVMEGDMPWFNANDVCQALGYLNTRQTLDDHVDRKTGIPYRLDTVNEEIQTRTSSTSQACMP